MKFSVLGFFATWKRERFLNKSLDTSTGLYTSLSDCFFSLDIPFLSYFSADALYLLTHILDFYHHCQLLFFQKRLDSVQKRLHIVKCTKYNSVQNLLKTVERQQAYQLLKVESPGPKLGALKNRMFVFLRNKIPLF